MNQQNVDSLITLLVLVVSFLTGYLAPAIADRIRRR